MNLKIVKEIGQGSYGSVVKCTSDDGKLYAVKKIHREKEDLPCLMEASVLSSFKHPSLMSAERVFMSGDDLYIVMELATSDLAKHCRKDKGGSPPNLATRKKWAYSLCHAVACLHQEGIIHGDIKASNILLMSNGEVRLGDYTLAWLSHGRKGQSTVQTITHRALEILLRQSWDEKVDVWALGCTLYEMAYGKLLFPFQAEGIEDISDEKLYQRLLRQRSIECLYSWQEYLDHGILSQKGDHLPFSFSADFSRAENSTFNSLLFDMLRVNPNDRPTMKEVLQHRYFTGIQATPFFRISTLTVGDMSEGAQAYFNLHLSDDLSLHLVESLYRRSVSLETTTPEEERLKQVACLRIALQLLKRLPSDDIPISDQVREWECKICDRLGYRLHFLV